MVTIRQMRKHRFRRLLCLAAVAAMLLAARPVSAAEGETEALPVWQHALFKTATYEFLGNLSDIPLYRFLLGGTLAGAGLFTAVNVVSASATYYTYEVLWDLYGPSLQKNPETAVEIGLQKTIAYRVLGTARNMALVYAFAGSASVSVTFALISSVIDTGIYAVNEYAWYTYGPPLEGAQIKSTAIPVRTVLPRRSEVDDLTRRGRAVRQAKAEAVGARPSLK